MALQLQLRVSLHQVNILHGALRHAQFLAYEILHSNGAQLGDAAFRGGGGSLLAGGDDGAARVVRVGEKNAFPSLGGDEETGGSDVHLAGGHSGKQAVVVDILNLHGAAHVGSKAVDELGIHTHDILAAHEDDRLGAGLHAHDDGLARGGDVQLGHLRGFRLANPLVADALQLAALAQAGEELIELLAELLALVGMVERHTHEVLGQAGVFVKQDIGLLASQRVADDVIHDGGVADALFQSQHHVCLEIVALQLQLRVRLHQVNILHGALRNPQLFTHQVFHGYVTHGGHLCFRRGSGRSFGCDLGLSGYGCGLGGCTGGRTPHKRRYGQYGCYEESAYLHRSPCGGFHPRADCITL